MTETSKATTSADIAAATSTIDEALSRLENSLAGQSARAEEIEELKQALAEARQEIELLTKENADMKAAFANSERKRLGVEAKNRETSGRLDSAIDRLQTILEAA